MPGLQRFLEELGALVPPVSEKIRIESANDERILDPLGFEGGELGPPARDEANRMLLQRPRGELGIVKGGDWGWIERSTLRAELAAIAFKLKPGEMSDVISTPQYCYLMLVEAAKPSHIRPLADVREEIERELTQVERTAQQAKYVEKLKAKAFLRYF